MRPRRKRVDCFLGGQKRATERRSEQYSAEIKAGMDRLHNAIERLWLGREIVSPKVEEYSQFSTDFDTFVETFDSLTGTEGLTEAHCGAFEADVIERGLKRAMSKAGQGFEEYYDAL